MRAGLFHFMSGRYGTDRLNMVILCVGVAASILSAFFQQYWWGRLAWVLSYALMIWAIFRSLSRNTYKRYEENRKFLLFFDRIKDHQHRYFTCPKCKSRLRVPRGVGSVTITCKSCGNKFDKKA